MTFCDSDKASGETIEGSDIEYKRGGGEAGGADRVSSISSPVVQGGMKMSTSCISRELSYLVGSIRNSE